MATARGLIKCFTRGESLKGLGIFLRSASSPGSTGKPNGVSGDLINIGGLRELAFERRNFRTSSISDREQWQLEADMAASDPAPGFMSTSLPLRNYTPVLSGFSVLPNPAAPGIAVGLNPSSNAKNFTLEQLGREMSNCLSQGRLEETVQLFEDWVRFPDIQGASKVPNLLAYNLLLHAKLRLGVDPRNMLQVIKEMEMNGLKPTLISYNFLLRAIFRQRDSKMAEVTLAKMEQSGKEAQPDGDSYNFVIVLCALDRRLDPAMKHLRSMYDRGYVPSKTTYNELLLTATRLHRSRAAVSVMKDLKKRNVVPQLQTVVELAVAAAESDDPECARLALSFLTSSELIKSARNLSMDEGGIYYLLSSAARAADSSLSSEAWTLLRHSLRETKNPGPSSYLARIHALAAAGDINAAYETLRELESACSDALAGADAEIFSPFSSLRPLVLACSRGGLAALDAAYYKLAEMHANGQPVPLSAINCVIQGCANAWDYDRAYQTFETIGTTFGLVPDVHSCNSLLDAFGKTRKTPEVLQIFDYMREVAVTPDERTYSLLVDAHVVNRDPVAAIEALNTMISAGYSPQRETLQKIWRRCRKESDEGNAQHVVGLMKKLGYRETQQIDAKWAQINSI